MARTVSPGGKHSVNRSDGHGRRVKQTNTDRTIYSVYGLNGTLILRDEIENGATDRTEYIRLGGELVAKVENDTPTYVHNDHLGSPVAATDVACPLLSGPDCMFGSSLEGAQHGTQTAQPRGDHRQAA